MKPTIGTAVALLGAMLVGQPTLAHAKLVSADPPSGGVAKQHPRTLTLAFSEELSGKLSGATVKRSDGAPVGAKVSVTGGGKSLALMLAAPLASGRYLVNWHAVASDDGHRTSGTYMFTVR